MPGVRGLHHVTAIAGAAQENLDFYAGVLGMRLVKRSVNQDDPKTYHLFYADAEGHPGSDLTFFPWEQLAPPRPGHGTAVEVSLEVPPGSLDYWGARLRKYGVHLHSMEERFGERVLPMVDPHGLGVALVEAEAPRAFTPFDAGPVPPDRQVRGLHGVRLLEAQSEPTTAFVTRRLGLQAIGQHGGWSRYGVSGASGVIDIQAVPGGRGSWGVGAIHHLAWRVDDEEHQLAVRAEVLAGGGRPTPVIDRFWFKSVYFLEPGGVLFELATDGPGFAVDEDKERLGETLVLPPWLEPRREEIEAALPPLSLPARAMHAEGR